MKRRKRIHLTVVSPLKTELGTVIDEIKSTNKVDLARESETLDLTVDVWGVSHPLSLDIADLADGAELTVTVPCRVSGQMIEECRIVLDEDGRPIGIIKERYPDGPTMKRKIQEANAQPTRTKRRWRP